MAVWIDEGWADSAGRRRSRAASTARRSSSKKGESFIARGKRLPYGSHEESRFCLSLRVESLGGEFAIRFFEKNFDAAFCLFELFLAFAGERHAFFEESHRIVQRKLRAFEPADDLFEAGERALEIGLLWRFGLFGCRGIHAV